MLLVMVKSLSNHKRRKRILQYVLDKGFDGASIREVMGELRSPEQDIPAASIISNLNRLVALGQIVEKRIETPQGYIRRFYDPRYTQNSITK